MTFQRNNPTMYAVSGRAPHLNRRLLLSNEPDVHQHDFDPISMDKSPEHRDQMKKILYSKSCRKESYDPKIKREAGKYNWNYADEAPPKWISTTKAEYIPKPLTLDTKREDIASYIKGSHFSLHGPETNLPSPKSITKSDYSAKPLQESVDIVKELLKKQSTGVHYPPIFRDESALTMIRPTDDPTRQTFSIQDTSNQLKKVDTRAKNAAHISFGNDDPVWQSVTSSVMLPHPRQAKPPPSEYELLEKKRSTVLDHPDIEPGAFISVQKQDYNSKADVERSQLMVDNAASIKDLKSTHFTLGNDDKVSQISQYQANFNSNNLVGATQSKALTSKDHASSKFCIIVEDYEDRRIGQSSHQSDFTRPQATTSSQRLNSAARHIKAMNLKTSISFANEDLQNMNSSVTSSEYRRPSERDADIAKEAYARKVIIKPGSTNYNHLDMGAASTKDSVARADYVACDYEVTKSFQPSDNFKAMIKADHFSIGDPNYDESKNQDRQASVTRRHFDAPNMSKSEIECIRPAGLVSNNITKRETFEDTLNKTVSRYPNENTVKESVTSTTYVSFTNVQRPLPYIPSKYDQISDYLQPTTTKVPVDQGQVPLKFEPIQDWSTSYRRTYVSPEFMKFINEA